MVVTSAASSFHSLPPQAHMYTHVHTQEYTQSILPGSVEAVWDLVLESRKWPWWRTGQDDRVE